MPSAVALVPARSGSQRVPDKNVRPLAGHPLLAYTVSAALDAGVFGAVVVSTDSEDYARIGRHYGAEVPALRPAEMAGATSPDIQWVQHTLDALHHGGRDFELFAILRPTSPFRQAGTIRRAWATFLDALGDGGDAADSLRAVEPCGQHPGKMWTLQGRRMLPLMPFTLATETHGDQPWHSNQKAALPPVYVQNASLEIARTAVVREQGTIAGTSVVPFFTEGDEGFDINSPPDWSLAEQMVTLAPSRLPAISQPPFAG